MLTEFTDINEKPRDSYGSDVLSAFNMANAPDGLLVKIARDTKDAPPLQIIQCLSSSLACHSRLVVQLGEGAELRLKQTLVSFGPELSPSLFTSNTRVLLGPRTTLNHAYAQELGLESRHLEVLSAEVDAGSLYALTAVQTGARLGRMNIHINLNAPDANCTVSHSASASSKLDYYCLHLFMHT